MAHPRTLTFGIALSVFGCAGSTGIDGYTDVAPSPTTEDRGIGETVCDEPLPVRNIDLSSQLGATGFAPVSAASDSGYLVAWSDHSGGDHADLYGAVIDDCGGWPEVVFLTLSTYPGDQHQVAVASNGDLYLAVWIDERDGDFALYGARVTRAGDVLDPSGFVIAAASGATQNPSVASNGGDFLVAYEANCGSGCAHGVFIQTVSVSAEIGESVRISRDSAPSYRPSVASLGGDYMVAWTDAGSGNHDVYVRPVNGAGEAQSAPIQVTGHSGHEVVPRIAAGDADYYVAWQDTRDTIDIYGTAISAAGNVRQFDGELLTRNVRWLDRPSLSADPAGRVKLTWSANDSARNMIELKAASVTRMTDVTMISATPIVTGASNYENNRQVSVSSRATSRLYLWQVRDGRNWRIRGSLIAND